MHCWPSSIRYCPCSSASVLAERDRRLRPGGRGHELELVDPRDRRVQEAEAVLAPLHLQHRVRGAVDGEDVADEAVVREVLEERLAPPLGVRPRVAGGRELAPPVVEVLVGGDAVVQPAVVQRERDVVLDVEGAVGVVGPDARAGAGPGSRRRRPGCSPGRRSGRGRPCPCRRWPRCGPSGGRGTRRTTASPGRRRRPASSGRGCPPTLDRVALGLRAEQVRVVRVAVATPARCGRCAGGSGTSSPATPKSCRSRLSGFSSRWFSNRTSTGLPYSALIIGPGNVPLKP